MVRSDVTTRRASSRPARPKPSVGNKDQSQRPKAKAAPAVNAKRAEGAAVSGTSEGKAVVKVREEVRRASETRLNEVINALFRCYDLDEDDQIERTEWLQGEETRQGRLEFNMKQRKESIQFFKDSGAIGSATEGMFLSHDCFRAAMIKLAGMEKDVDEDDPGALADWLQDTYGVKLLAVRAPPVSVSGQQNSPQANAVAPTYPKKIKISGLKDALTEARKWNRHRILIVNNGLAQVDSFFEYSSYTQLDCKRLIGEHLLKKSMSLKELQQTMRTQLTWAMGRPETNFFAKPLWIQLGNSAFDFEKYCSDDGMPGDVFDGALWTGQHAFEKGLIDDAHRVEIQVSEKFDDFFVVLTSAKSMDFAEEHLRSKIPHFDQLAIFDMLP